MTQSQFFKLGIWIQSFASLRLFAETRLNSPAFPS